MHTLTPLSLLALTHLATAACTGIHSFTACADNIVHWFDPNTGEVCDPLDCGGGRAPVKYDVPGCDAYTGTEVYNPTTSILSCWTPATASATTTTESVSETASVSVSVHDAVAVVTGTEDGDDDATVPTTSATVSTSTTLISAATPSTTPAPTSSPASTSPTQTGTETETPSDPEHTGAAAGLHISGGSLMAGVVAILGMVNLV
ncbi:hypothetical protein BJY04DRAFT_179649 [Aspergillus karnatakaensis]|uniref:uncharacterized protein n=1 Tax=Aspergillus karnatakaensis TaxID=1810916 RepID=UPI003CCDEB4D